jgi:hypothetical protein
MMTDFRTARRWREGGSEDRSPFPMVLKAD